MCLFYILNNIIISGMYKSAGNISKLNVKFFFLLLSHLLCILFSLLLLVVIKYRVYLYIIFFLNTLRKKKNKNDKPKHYVQKSNNEVFGMLKVHVPVVVRCVKKTHIERDDDDD